MSKLLDILLQRNDPSVPWGFSIHGGFDKDVAPFVSSVTFGTLAARHLNAGDRVLQIQKQPAGGLLQSELEKQIQDRGKELQLLVEKTSCTRTNGHFDVSTRHKSFLRFSEAFIEDHFKRVRDLLEDALSFHRSPTGTMKEAVFVLRNPFLDWTTPWKRVRQRQFAQHRCKHEERRWQGVTRSPRTGPATAAGPGQGSGCRCRGGSRKVPATRLMADGERGRVVPAGTAGGGPPSGPS